MPRDIVCHTGGATGADQILQRELSHLGFCVRAYLPLKLKDTIDPAALALHTGHDTRHADWVDTDAREAEDALAAAAPQLRKMIHPVCSL